MSYNSSSLVLCHDIDCNAQGSRSLHYVTKQNCVPVAVNKNRVLSRIQVKQLREDVGRKFRIYLMEGKGYEIWQTSEGLTKKQSWMLRRATTFCFMLNLMIMPD